MPFNLLLLPLLGGLIFVRRWKRTRYYALRSQGYVLLFYGATAGAFFLIVATFLTAPTLPALERLSKHWECGSVILWYCRHIDSLWHLLAPFDHSGKTVLAGLLGALAWIPANEWWDEDEEIDRIIKERGDPLEVFLRTALGTGKPVMLTVKNGKVYVGIVFSNLNPAMPLVSVLLLPIWSGYRSDETKTVTITTRYVDAYIGIADEAKALLQKQDSSLEGEALDKAVADYIDTKTTRFEVVILVEEIQSVNSFDLEIYERFFQHFAKARSPYRPKEHSTVK